MHCYWIHRLHRKSTWLDKAFASRRNVLFTKHELVEFVLFVCHCMLRRLWQTIVVLLLCFTLVTPKEVVAKQ